MRLLAIEPGLKLYGSERAFLATVPALVAANEHVVIMHPANAELQTPLASLGVTTVTAPIGNLHRSGQLARLKAADAIVRACLRHRITKIYLNQAGLCRIVHRIAALLRIPLAIHVRLVEDIPRCAALAASPPVDLIHISDDMRARHPADRMAGKRIVTVYDPYPFTTPTGVKDIAPNTSPPEHLFCCVGRLAAIKGQEKLISAFHIAQQKGLAGALHLIGAAAPGDPYGDEVAALAATLVADGTVQFLGYRTDVDALVRQYRYSVIPSHYEPLGRVVMEAWDAGALPICSRDAGGCSEIVAASRGGLLYDGHDPKAIAGALIFAEALPEPEREKMVARGCDWARQHLSIEAYRTVLEGVIFA